MVIGRWQYLALAGVLFARASPAQLWPSDASTVEGQLLSSSADERRGVVSALDRLPGEEASRIVLRALRSSDDGVRVDAARLAARLRLAPAAAAVGHWLVEPSVELRRAALQVLERVPAPELVPTIARLLSDGAAEVRVAACVALAFQAKGEAPPALVGRLDDPVVEVRLAAIEALARLRSPHAVIPLAGVVQGDDARLREAGVMALGAIGSTEATPSLMLALSDAEPGVRAAAVMALGAVEAEGAEAAFMALLDREQVPRVRVAVVDELAKCGTVDAARAIVGQLCGETRSRWERERAVRALRAAGVVATRVLESCVVEATRVEAALRCAEALVTLGDGHTREILVAALDAGSLPTAAGLRLLGAVGDADALPFVLERLDDSDEIVRRAAISAVSELIHPSRSEGRVIAPLRGALRRAHSMEERSLVVRALGRTASPAVLADLAPLVAVEAPRSLRIAAVEALAHVGGVERDRLLIGLLSDRDGGVRWAAAWSLRRGFDSSAGLVLAALYRGEAMVERDLVALAMGGARPQGLAESGRQALLGLLAHERGARRDSLLEASLFEGAGRSSVDARVMAGSAREEDRAKVAELCEWLPASRELLLRGLLGDSSLRVRANAAWALGAVGSPEDVPALLRVIVVEGGVVGGNAVAALGRIAERHGLKVSGELCRALSNPSPLARVNALAALTHTQGRCSEELEYAALRLDPSYYVRLAAAVMMNGSGGEIARSRSDALLECARSETHGRVAAACVERRQGGVNHESEELLVFVVGAGHEEPTPEAPFAIELPSGYVRVGIADRRGAVLLRTGERGTVRLLPPDVVMWPTSGPPVRKRGPQ